MLYRIDSLEFKHINNIDSIPVDPLSLLIAPWTGNLSLVNDEYLNTQGVIIYPNPFSNNINIVFPKAGITTIALFDITGSLLSTSTHAKNTISIPTSSLPKGVYILEIYSESIGIKVAKIIKI